MKIINLMDLKKLLRLAEFSLYEERKIYEQNKSSFENAYKLIKKTNEHFQDLATNWSAYMIKLALLLYVNEDYNTRKAEAIENIRTRKMKLKKIVKRARHFRQSMEKASEKIEEKEKLIKKLKILLIKNENQ